MHPRLHDPRFGALNGYQWLLFLGAHEKRHTDQISEIQTTLNASAND
jgi:hypothetical protein